MDIKSELEQAIENANHNANIAGKYQVRIKELKEAMQEFVDRVDKGEVKSIYTYSKFKELLSKDHLY